MRKKIMLSALILGLAVVSFSYEDYYEKVYKIKISKNSIYEEVEATQKQQKKLDRIFKKYQKKAEKLEKKLLRFENKKTELGKIEAERYEDILKILSAEQMKSFNTFINKKKTDFEEKNDKIKNLIDSLYLANEQKSEILRYERNFQRYINSGEMISLSPEKYIIEYEKAKNERNEKIRGILSEEQIKKIEETNKK